VVVGFDHGFPRFVSDEAVVIVPGAPLDDRP
jgi:hypothetical protein